MHAIGIGFAIFLVLAIAIANPLSTAGLVLIAFDNLIKSAKWVKSRFTK